MKVQRDFKNQSAFSLIELIGVLAIIAIILSAAAPNIIKLIKNEKYDAEEVTIEEIGDALIAFVENRQTIPGNNGWADSLAPFLDLSPSSLTSTIGGSRRYIVHPSFTVGIFPNSAFNQDSMTVANSDIPFSTQPTQAQIIIASNLYDTLPSGTISSADFTAIWNQTGTIPSGFTIGDSVSLQRISLNSFFHPVIFNVSSAPATYAVNSTDVADEITWPTTTQTRYVLKNTQIVTRDVASGDITGTYLVNNSEEIGAPPNYSGITSSAAVSSSTTVSSSVAVSSSSLAGIDCSAVSGYTGGTTYNTGDEVKKNIGGGVYKKYTSLTNGNKGNDPSSSPGQWNEDGTCL